MDMKYWLLSFLCDSPIWGKVIINTLKTLFHHFDARKQEN